MRPLIALLSIVMSTSLYSQMNHHVSVSIPDYFCNTVLVGPARHDQFKIYPNPANSKILISNVHSDAGLKAELIDLAGHVYVVMEHFGDEIELDIMPLPSGVYILHITTQDRQFSSKIVIEK